MPRQPQNKIREEREKSRLSQRELALLVGYSKVTVSRQENNQIALTAEAVERYREVFKLATGAELFFEFDPDGLVEAEPDYEQPTADHSHLPSGPRPPGSMPSALDLDENMGVRRPDARLVRDPRQINQQPSNDQQPE